MTHLKEGLYHFMDPFTATPTLVARSGEKGGPNSTLAPTPPGPRSTSAATSPKPGGITRVVGLFRLFVLALFATISMQASAQTVSLSAGWNLLGNSSSTALDVVTTFNDTAQVNTVWKWVAPTAKWAFYAPSLSAADLQAYATSQGYEVLTSINGGEGFWVNAKVAFGAQLPAGTAVTAASLRASLTMPGWNLISIGDNKTPAEVGQALISPPISLWAWNAAQTNWYFYAASLVAQGANALVNYITSKNYLDFGTLTLSPTTGFWVNMLATTAPVSSTTTAASTSSTSAATTTTTVAATTTTTVSVPPAIWYFNEGAALTPSQITSFDAEELYFNVHSAANPGGEIRSQIIPASPGFLTDNGNPSTSNTISTLLSGDQEVPANTSRATGYATIVLDPVNKTISGAVVTSGIVGTAAHIHNGLPGANGPVLFPLTGGPTVWTVPSGTVLTDAQIASLTSGAYYVNVHSTAAPGGEIRGQLNQQLRFAALSGANEVPAATTTASGIGVLALNPTTSQISGFVRTTGITGTAAHIHEAAAGANGGVIVPLTQTPAGSGLWVVPAGQLLTAARVVSFNAGNLYFNVHSAANPGGEIRSQIVPATIKVGTAALDGTKEVPAVTTAASGTGIMALNSITQLVSGNVRTTGINGTAAHVHAGVAGANGPVIVPLTATAPASTLQTATTTTTTTTTVVTTTTTTAVAATVSFATQIQPILTANCTTGCHSPGGIASFMNLAAGSAYATLLQSATPSVIAGSSATSKLYGRITGTLLPVMPIGAPPLSAADQALIRDWIDQGAANN